MVECVRRPRVGEHAFTSHHLPNNIVQAFEQQAAEEWCPPFLELDTTNKTSREGGVGRPLPRVATAKNNNNKHACRRIQAEERSGVPPPHEGCITTNGTIPIFEEGAAF